MQPSGFRPKLVIPLFILAAGLGWYLNGPTADDNNTPSLGFTDDVDYYLKNVTSQRFQADGSLQYRLKAELAKHYRSSKSIALQKPVIVYHIGASDSDNSYQWNIRADEGWFLEAQAQQPAKLQLKTNVWIEREQTDQLAVTTQAEEIWFEPDSGELYSTKPVTITQGQHRINASGLSINTNSNSIRLTGGVKARYSPANSPQAAKPLGKRSKPG